MQKQFHRQSIRLLVLALASLAPFVEVVHADPAPEAFTAPRRPLLDQLNRETRQLYDQVKHGVVRVQLPPALLMNNANVVSRDKLLQKYKLDPAMKQQIEQQDPKSAVADKDPRGPVGEAIAERTGDNTQTVGPETATDAVTQGKATYIVIPPQNAQADPSRDPISGGKLEMDLKAPAAFTPNNVGLVLVGGYAIVPLYIEREAGADQTIRLAGQDGQVVEAKFVGSDRQTNLTVIKTEASLGDPIRLGKEKPEEGSLVMMIAPADGSGRLGLWTGGGQEFSVVFNSDGEMAGIARFGQFLTGSSCKLIADEIIRHGSVKRATLGVILSEIRKDDPLRQQAPVLGGRSAMRIDEVMPGSAADKAGLQKGDLVLALAGDAVSDIPSFAAAIASKSGKTEIQLLRGEKTVNVSVDLQPK